MYCCCAELSRVKLPQRVVAPPPSILNSHITAAPPLLRAVYYIFEQLRQIPAELPYACVHRLTGEMGNCFGECNCPVRALVRSAMCGGLACPVLSRDSDGQVRRPWYRAILRACSEISRCVDDCTLRPHAVRLLRRPVSCPCIRAACLLPIYLSTHIRAAAHAWNCQL